MFKAMEDEYMRARAADVKDISRRVVNVLLGVGDADMMADQPAILVADEYLPSEVMDFDQRRLLGLITGRAAWTATPPCWYGPTTSPPLWR